MMKFTRALALSLSLLATIDAALAGDAGFLPNNNVWGNTSGARAPAQPVPLTGLITYADMASAALATASQYIAGTASTIVPASVIYTSEVTVTYGTTTTFDFSTFNNAAVTLTGNITTMTLSNVTAGKAGTITFIQGGAGSFTTVWNSTFKFPGGITPTLSTAVGAIDVLSYSCRSAAFCVASLMTNVH